MFSDEELKRISGEENYAMDVRLTAELILETRKQRMPQGVAAVHVQCSEPKPLKKGK
jgi:hypothetical protein